MLAAGVRRQPRADLLSITEIVRVVEVAAGLSIRKIRLTDGEPLIRPDLPALARAIARIPDIEEISLTTNGILLEKLAAPQQGASPTRRRP